MRYKTKQPYEPSISRKRDDSNLFDLYRESIEEHYREECDFNFDDDEIPYDDMDDCPDWIKEQIDEESLDDEIPF